MAVVELAQSQSIGACEADVPGNSGGNAVSGGSPQQSGQVVGQQLEFHVDADHLPVALDSGDGIQQVSSVVNCLDGVGAVPTSLSQQLLCQFGVVAVLGQTVSLPEAIGNQGLLCSDNGVLPQTFDDSVDVDGVPQSLTDTGILQGLCIAFSYFNLGSFSSGCICCGCSGSSRGLSLGAACEHGEHHAQSQNQSKNLLH